MNRLRNIGVVILGVVPLLVSGLTGCAVDVNGVICEGNTNNVHHSAGTPSNIVAKSTVKCPAAVSVSGYVEIQRKNTAGSWYTYKRTTISPFTTKAGVTYTRQAASTCSKGSFRNKTYVSGTYNGKTVTGTTYSGVTVNPCG